MEDLDDMDIIRELQDLFKNTQSVPNLGTYLASIFKLPLRLETWEKDDIASLSMYKFEYTDTGVNGEGSNAKFVGSITLHDDEIFSYTKPVIKDDEI